MLQSLSEGRPSPCHHKQQVPRTAGHCLTVVSMYFWHASVCCTEASPSGAQEGKTAENRHERVAFEVRRPRTLSFQPLLSRLKTPLCRSKPRTRPYRCGVKVSCMHSLRSCAQTADLYLWGSSVSWLQSAHAEKLQRPTAQPCGHGPLQVPAFPPCLSSTC